MQSDICIKTFVLDYFEVDGVTYYYNTGDDYFNFYEAKDLCASLNMTLIRFETTDKFFALLEWAGCK